MARVPGGRRRPHLHPRRAPAPPRRHRDRRAGRPVGPGPERPYGASAGGDRGAGAEGGAPGGLPLTPAGVSLPAGRSSPSGVSRTRPFRPKGGPGGAAPATQAPTRGASMDRRSYENPPDAPQALALRLTEC
ncbi:hypothetical protein SAM23877_4557 [Streptomyces ambofaciens ATCC 23877]|uniref:Uncharacterized protein n=1 Tax=Streptomyces ambofaciens (strain ATCC 23877 / 3486 / DSM 40053 / JCM 4204 / NBRC 12836 / NRRL B-2516) TaxID=278992 RepID=A0A0K2AXR2_STRA7|nr:hypothetical protein SAM23877_4557 [Streptomyces ambofaciens ATCC 23877]